MSFLGREQYLVDLITTIYNSIIDNKHEPSTYHDITLYLDPYIYNQMEQVVIKDTYKRLNNKIKSTLSSDSEEEYPSVSKDTVCNKGNHKITKYYK
jgi:hypothetical protein